MNDEDKEEDRAREVLILSHEDIAFLKELIDDRKAVGRVWSKIRTFLVATAAIIIAWGTLAASYKDIIGSIKRWVVS